MALKTDSVQLDEIAGDVSTPADGEVWYNTTTDRHRLREGGVSHDVSRKGELDTHEGTANPHGTTLEDARSVGNTLSGPVAMGGSKITGLGAGSAATDAASIQNVDDKIAAKIQGFVWQSPVLDDDLVTAPGSPTTGDRYIIAGIGGAWSGFTIDDVVEWDGSSWINETPIEGFATRLLDEDRFKVYNGSAWEFFALSVDHNGLLNLTSGDPHTQYVKKAGDTLTGDLVMGANNITLAGGGLVDGVDVDAHGARHIQGGADEMDGDQLDIDFTPSNYTPSTVPAEATDVDQLTAHLAGIDDELVAMAGPVTKTGNVLAASFSGNPKKATVTFNTAHASAAYAAVATAVTTGASFTITVESQVAGSFVLNAGANNIGTLTQVNWNATADNNP